MAKKIKNLDIDDVVAAVGNTDVQVEDEATVLGSLQKGKVTKIVVTAKYWSEKLYMDFRQFHMNDDGAYMPTKKGFMVPYELVGDFFDMIDKVSKGKL